MLFSKIFADPKTFQERETDFSMKTVEAIVKEGINLAKFDHLPVIMMPDGRACVGGDGHSRFEAIRRLASEKPPRLPKEWKKGKDYDIPHREVTRAVAEELALTANLSRDNFTPCEEAKVYQKMLDRGFAIEEVARRAHKTVTYVSNMLPLNVLIRDIRERVGKHPDAGGIDKQIAQAMAERFKRYQIGAQQQQELWFKIFCQADLTVNFVRKILDRIAPEVQKKQVQGALFEIPSNVTGILKQMRGRADALRQAQRGLAWLIQCNRESDVLQAVPDLKHFLDKEGEQALSTIKEMESEEAGLIGEICTGGR